MSLTPDDLKAGSEVAYGPRGREDLSANLTNPKETMRCHRLPEKRTMPLLGRMMP